MTLKAHSMPQDLMEFLMSYCWQLELVSLVHTFMISFMYSGYSFAIFLVCVLTLMYMCSVERVCSYNPVVIRILV